MGGTTGIGSNLTLIQQIAIMKATVDTIAYMYGMSSYLEVHVLYVGDHFQLKTNYNGIDDFTNRIGGYRTCVDGYIGYPTWSSGEANIKKYHTSDGNVMWKALNSDISWRAQSAGYDFISTRDPDKLYAFIVIKK